MTTSVRAAVSPLLLAWARERSGLEVDDLYRRIVAVIDRALVHAPTSEPSPSQPDGTVAR